MAALETYGAVSDFPFPQVAPTASKAELVQLAEQLAGELHKSLLTEAEPKAVLIAGEQGLVFHTVLRLQALGLCCVAATSERKVVQLSDTEKQIVFDFVQFREF